MTATQSIQFEVQIWHAKVPAFSPLTILPTCLSDSHRLVDTVIVSSDGEAAALERVFDHSQNLDTGWKKGERSTSVGDILVILGAPNKVFSVADVGMLELTAAIK